MSLLHKEYLKIGDNEIKFSITFNREKINWATSQPKKIGYQVSAIPVKRTQREGYSMEESTAFSGFLDCLLEVDRQSSKRLQQAITELNNRKEKYKQYFIERYGWLDTPATTEKIECEKIE